MSIPLPSGYVPSLLPEIAIAVQLGVGATPARADFRVVLLGNKTSAGLASNSVPIEVTGPDDGNAQCGSRSELAAMARAFFKVAPRGRLWVCPVAENGSGTAATAELLFATSAAANGAVRIRINGRLLPEVTITTGDAANTIAAAVNTMIAAYDEELPVTSGVSSATVTLTAANVGPRGNNIRVVCEIVPAGTTAVATTVGLNGGTGASKVDGRLGAGDGTAGTDFVVGAGADDFTAALAAVYAADFDFLGCACSDDTNRGLVTTHVTSASAISEGRRRAAVCGSMEGTLATVQADAVAANNPRFQIGHLKGAHNSTGEIAAAYLAAHIYGDGRLRGIAQKTSAKQNGLQLFPAIYAPELADYTTNNQKATLLANGVTPLAASRLYPGYAEVVRPVTTRTLAVSGATSYAVIDPSKVRVADEVARRWGAFASVAYADKNLAPDPTDPDAAPSADDVVWPSAMREDVLALLRTMEDEGKLVNVNAHAASVAVSADGSDDTVAVVVIPVAVIPHLHSVVTAIQQVA
jgi:phage tail sheath gpL-like